MNYTRKYYEELLDALSEIVTIKSLDYETLNLQKENLESLISRIVKYDILNIEVQDRISNELKSKEKNRFGQKQSILAEFLYNNLGSLLYTFERTEREAEYATALEIYRTELPFNIVSKWNILENKNKKFSSDLLFFDMNKKWTSIDNNSEFEAYKKELRSKNIELRYFGKPKPISKKKLKELTKLFQGKLDEVIHYIDTHYPSIKQDFTLYDSNVRMYIIDRNGRPGETIRQTKIYKYLNPKNKVLIYPYLLNLATRFNNLEEIEVNPLVFSESLNDLDNPEKYGHDFDLKLVHFELLYIFLKNCSKSQKKEFLKYLIRSNLATHVNDGEFPDELHLMRNDKCKLFIDNTPNLNSIKKLVVKGEYKYVAFTNRPDQETYSFLGQANVKILVIDEIARNYINIGNGEQIHHYIKDRLNDLNINVQYPNKAQELLFRLKNCPLGLEGWSEFEEIGDDIFEYLFGDNFRRYTKKNQSYTNDKIFRRDLIVNNNFNDTTSIWGQAKSDFNCNLIVVDFKNYAEPLEQNEFYIPSKYLNINTGKFGILFTRNGLGNSAKTLQKRMLNLNNELLIVLSESDLIQMINEKSLNQDPSYRLENIKFSLYETI
jgi:hypothetical protein